MKSIILTIHEMEILLFIWVKMIKRLEMLKNTVNKYMTDIRPDRLTTCQVRTEVGISRRPGVHDSYL
jgi:hypothetical protein